MSSVSPTLKVTVPPLVPVPERDPELIVHVHVVAVKVTVAPEIVPFLSVYVLFAAAVACW
jgi:hypothetical protein